MEKNTKTKAYSFTSVQLTDAPIDNLSSLRDCLDGRHFKEQTVRFFVKLHEVCADISNLPEEIIRYNIDRSMDPEERQRYRQVLDKMILCGHKTELSGSVAEVWGSNLEELTGGPGHGSDKDIMIILPKHLFYAVPPGCSYPAELSKDLKIIRLKPSNHPGYVVNDELQKWKDKNTSHFGRNATIDKKVIRKRAAITSTEISSSSESGIASVDWVIAVQCTSWPTEAQRWKYRTRRWPSREMVEECSKLECFIVNAGNPENTEEVRETEWRFSFSKQEKYLINNFTDKQGKIYTILKKFVKSTGDCITSYFIKTFFFWWLEKNENLQVLFSSETLLNAISELREKIEDNDLKNYFMPEVPVFIDKKSPAFYKQCRKLRSIIFSETQCEDRRHHRYICVKYDEKWMWDRCGFRPFQACPRYGFENIYLEHFLFPFESINLHKDRTPTLTNVPNLFHDFVSIETFHYLISPPNLEDAVKCWTPKDNKLKHIVEWLIGIHKTLEMIRQKDLPEKGNSFRATTSGIKLGNMRKMHYALLNVAEWHFGEQLTQEENTSVDSTPSTLDVLSMFVVQDWLHEFICNGQQIALFPVSRTQRLRSEDPEAHYVVYVASLRLCIKAFCNETPPGPPDRGWLIKQDVKTPFHVVIENFQFDNNDSRLELFSEAERISYPQNIYRLYFAKCTRQNNDQYKNVAAILQSMYKADFVADNDDMTEDEASIREFFKDPKIIDIINKYEMYKELLEEDYFERQKLEFKEQIKKVCGNKLDNVVFRRIVTKDYEEPRKQFQEKDLEFLAHISSKMKQLETKNIELEEQLKKTTEIQERNTEREPIQERICEHRVLVCNCSCVHCSSSGDDDICNCRLYPFPHYHHWHKAVCRYYRKTDSWCNTS